MTDKTRYYYRVCDEHGNFLDFKGTNHIVLAGGRLVVENSEGRAIFDGAPRGWSWVRRHGEVKEDENGN
jgi:hypothetical protein